MTSRQLLNQTANNFDAICSNLSIRFEMDNSETLNPDVY